MHQLSEDLIFEAGMNNLQNSDYVQGMFAMLKYLLQRSAPDEVMQEHSGVGDSDNMLNENDLIYRL